MPDVPKNVGSIGAASAFVEVDDAGNVRLNPTKAVKNMDASELTLLLDKYVNATGGDQYVDLVQDYTTPEGKITKQEKPILELIRQSISDAAKEKDGHTLRGPALLDKVNNAVRRSTIMPFDNNPGPRVIDQAVSTLAVEDAVKNQAAKLYGLPNESGQVYRVLRDDPSAAPQNSLRRSALARLLGVADTTNNPGFNDFLDTGFIRGSDTFRGLAYSNRNIPLANYWNPGSGEFSGGNMIFVGDEALLNSNPNYEVTAINDNVRNAGGRYFTFQPKGLVTDTGLTKTNVVNAEPIYPSWLKKGRTPQDIITALQGAETDADPFDAFTAKRNAYNRASVILGMLTDDHKTALEKANLGYYAGDGANESRWTQTNPDWMSETLGKQRDAIRKNYTVSALLGKPQNGVANILDLIERAPEIVGEKANRILAAEKAANDLAVRLMQTARGNEAPFQILAQDKESYFSVLDDMYRFSEPDVDRANLPLFDEAMIEKVRSNRPTSLTSGPTHGMWELALSNEGTSHWNPKTASQEALPAFRNFFRDVIPSDNKISIRELQRMDDASLKSLLKEAIPYWRNYKWSAASSDANNVLDDILGRINTRLRSADANFVTEREKPALDAIRELARRMRIQNIATKRVDTPGVSPFERHNVVGALKAIAATAREANTEGQIPIDDLVAAQLGAQTAELRKAPTLSYKSATPDIARAMLPSANKGIKIVHDPRVNPTVNIELPGSPRLMGYGRDFSSLDIPRDIPEWNVVYDKKTPFMKRPLPTHINNLYADAARARSLAPVLGQSLANDALVATRYGQAAMAKASPVLVPAQIGMQFAAANGAFGDTVEDREYGVSDPLGIRPGVDAVISLFGFDSSGKTYRERVNDPEWVKRNTLSATIQSTFTGNPGPLKAFLSGYVPGWNPDPWNPEDFKDKTIKTPRDNGNLR